MTTARQFSSRDFWSERRHQYELVVSELVEEECCKGDQEQVARRKEFLAEASLLPDQWRDTGIGRKFGWPGADPR